MLQFEVLNFRSQDGQTGHQASRKGDEYIEQHGPQVDSHEIFNFGQGLIKFLKISRRKPPKAVHLSFRMRSRQFSIRTANLSYIIGLNELELRGATTNHQTIAILKNRGASWN